MPAGLGGGTGVRCCAAICDSASCEGTRRCRALADGVVRRRSMPPCTVSCTRTGRPARGSLRSDALSAGTSDGLASAAAVHALRVLAHVVVCYKALTMCADTAVASLPSSI